jgi:hypothetical protein
MFVESVVRFQRLFGSEYFRRRGVKLLWKMEGAGSLYVGSTRLDCAIGPRYLVS